MNVRVRVDALRDDPNVKGKYLSDLFPKGFFNRFNYNDVEVGHCLHCKKGMTHNEMEPPDKLTPRAMHIQCFAEFTNGITEVCPICEGYLSNDKVNAQNHSPHDIHHRICEGRCMDYFSLVSCKVLGDDMSFVSDENDSSNNMINFELEPSTKEMLRKIKEMVHPPTPKRKPFHHSTPQQPPPQQPYQAPQRPVYQDPAELEQYRISQEERDYYDRQVMNGDEFDAEQNFRVRCGLSSRIFMLNHYINLTDDFNKRADYITQQNQAIAKYIDFCNQPIQPVSRQFDINGNEIFPDQQGPFQPGNIYRGKPVVHVRKKR